jgi:hypothetical protein
VPPFIEQVLSEGLAVLVSWDPSPTTDQVTGYTLSAAVASSFKGKVSSTCASPAAVSAPATDSSVLFPGLCAAIP